MNLTEGILGFCLLFSPIYLLEMVEWGIFNRFIFLRYFLVRARYNSLSSITKRLHEYKSSYPEHNENHYGKELLIDRNRHHSKVIGLKVAKRIVEWRYRRRVLRDKAQVKNYIDLRTIAEKEIETMSQEGVWMVAGPLFSGPGTFKEKLILFQETIDSYRAKGFVVWSQIPYLDTNLKECKELEFDSERKFLEFYIPLIKSGVMKGLIMAKNWEHAPGSTTEHKTAKESGKEIIYA